MLVKLGSTVVPVYLPLFVRPVCNGSDIGETCFRNSIRERFVNTMLVESQSSIPVVRESRSRENAEEAHQDWQANPSLSTNRRC